MQDKYRIVIIEDDATIRDSYEFLISQYEDFVVSETFASAEDALLKVTELDPHIILLDIELLGMSGLEALPKLKQACTDTYIIILSVYDQSQTVFQALESGASGYLTKDTDPEKVIEALYDVLHGGGPMSANIAKMVVSSFQRNLNTPLTKRETQILEEVSNGKTRGQIAKELFIDIETVKSHLKNIYSKLNVNSRAEAIRIAKHKKYIT